MQSIDPVGSCHAAGDANGPDLIAFQNTYAKLPPRFYAKLPPAPVAKPELIRVNRRLAAELGIDPERLESPEGVAALAGSSVFEGSEPLAMAYAGHQFGNWVHQLGDGRALLLGEIVDQGGRQRDLHLKGSGRTPFSRSGDGRAWLGPVLREYVVSEAMHALGIPTTRALAAVSTGETVYREAALPGAVFARVASSHVRVGTFQYFYARNDVEALKLLADHVIARLYPEARETDNPPLALLRSVVRAQAALVARWMGVGFIHGVMNTDNVSLAGETIDFGPCAFMDEYEPRKVFSSIDVAGRYAYSNQPSIAHWNLAQLATCLVPLIGDDHAKAVELATGEINEFGSAFNSEWLSVFGAKLGLSETREGDSELIADFLRTMAEGRADFTRAFRRLSDLGPELEGRCALKELFGNPDELDRWLEAWRTRTAADGPSPNARRERMLQCNPAIIPRNHRIEQLIAAAVGGDHSMFDDFNEALSRPYEVRAEHARYMDPPADGEAVVRTFCGT